MTGIATLEKDFNTQLCSLNIVRFSSLKALFFLFLF
jgi:hypothetical protein